MDLRYQYFVIEESIARGLVLLTHFSTVREAIIVTWVQVIQLQMMSRPEIYALKAHIAQEECRMVHSFVL